MPNQFDTTPVNALQALMGFNQSFKDASSFVKDRQTQAARQQAAQDIQSGNPQSAIARLIGMGDIQGASAVANIGHNDRDFAFRQQEAQRAQGNVDRTFNAPNIQKDENGNFVSIAKDGSGATVLPVTGSTPNNPFSYGKLNESQSKDAGYANRMFQSEGVLRDPKLAQASQSIFDRAADKILPGDMANNVVSEGYQKYDQAARDFINATLRRESGAAISASEFDNAYKQYLPRPGDTKEVLQQKQRNRQATIASIAGGGGNNYKPPFSFDPTGSMVPTGNAQQGVKSASPAQGGVTKEQYDALAPGTPYTAPDGSQRIKK